ncbi:hypothetical protein GBF38_014134 [Nibea albiflora]|uniref:Uncharacterized protein n=1 Tax=Nibea albiflora TaxID=240163 RepID=A0ACB7F6W5_NIBAL|nr:hypothetical protein GBF38_014134 [Nibea albiflora]
MLLHELRKVKTKEQTAGGMKVMSELGEVKRYLCSSVRLDWHFTVMLNRQTNRSPADMYPPVCCCMISQERPVNMLVNGTALLRNGDEDTQIKRSERKEIKGDLKNERGRIKEEDGENGEE